MRPLWTASRPPSYRPRTAPRDATEQAVADVWAAILDRPADTLSVFDDFFDLGGDSLRAHRVTVRVPHRDAVADVTSGRGAHVVYDGVGKATFDDSLAALRPRGTMVLYGAASGQVPPFDPQRLNYGGSLYLTRPTMASYIADREELLGRTRDLFGWIAAGELTVRIGATYPLADAAQAHEDLAARRTTGKLLLRP